MHPSVSFQCGCLVGWLVGFKKEVFLKKFDSISSAAFLFLGGGGAVLRCLLIFINVVITMICKKESVIL